MNPDIKNSKKSKKKRIWICIVLVLVIAASIGAYVVYKTHEFVRPQFNTTYHNYQYPRSEYKNLDLLVCRGDTIGFFDVEEWKHVNQEKYEKMGIVIDYDSCPAFVCFLTASDYMSWSEAVSRYGIEVLPSENQCKAIGRHSYEINRAIEAYGGSAIKGHYWGKIDDNPYSWEAFEANGYLSSKSRIGQGQVLGVFPLDFASAMKP